MKKLMLKRLMHLAWTIEEALVRVAAEFRAVGNMAEDRAFTMEPYPSWKKYRADAIEEMEHA